MSKRKTIMISIGAPTLAAVLADRLVSVPIFSSCWTALLWVGRMLAHSVSIPVWSVILIALALPLVFLLMLVFAKGRNSPSYLAYTSDRIFGINWHWKYIGGTLYPDEIIGRCPNCMTILDVRDRYQETHVECSHCQFKKVFSEGKDKLIRRLAKEVDRRIILEEWKEKQQTDRV